MKLIFFALLACLSSCGTDTGNPGITAGTPMNGTIMNFMVTEMCERLQTCSGLSQTTCMNGVYSAPNMTSSIGVNSVTYPTLNDAYLGYSRGEFRIESSNLQTCQNAITALSCSDSRVTGAYSSSSPSDFSSVYHLLSASSACSSITTP